MKTRTGDAERAMDGGAVPGFGDSDAEVLAEARRVLELEARALQDVAGRLGDSFVEAARLLAQLRGRVVVAGIGKSGVVARKIAATLTSTGTPATFLHPTEGVHGDLGIVGAHDLAIIVSKSGETDELAGLLDYLLRTGVPIVAVTGRSDSTLARAARLVLDSRVDEEACPMDLAPTTSTTAALAIGDALAVVTLQLNRFGPDDFARYHPGGALGRRLSACVGEVMVRDAYPSIAPGRPMRETVVPIAEKRGTLPVVDEGRLVGVVTAGDLTRLIERDPRGWPDTPVRDVMTHSPLVAASDERGSAALHRMESEGVMALPVVDGEHRLEGIVHLHDLMRAGGA
ncbi:MAG: KpsF/GutQ family sugar-phosphate isomerase [Longimicrobiales bacterium]|nr:KpsF/GutQ family sugar-phosphate isomerase [Longimicrobiales bacterium]